eukprot:GHVO01053438.1.p1 GENE.GHVO01053438.1~~GHVO01053438.1.p1  ORF type:complete len:186 (-),score=24.20 GHVO01053438.1:72-584(-)
MTPALNNISASWDTLQWSLDQLATCNPPTTEEFEAVKKPFLANILSAVETNAYWLSVITGLQIPPHPKDLEQAKDIYSAYASITLEHVKGELHTLTGSNCITCVGIAGPRAFENVLDHQVEAIDTKLRGKKNKPWRLTLYKADGIGHFTLSVIFVSLVVVGSCVVKFMYR